MRRRPPRSTRTDILFSYPSLFRSTAGTSGGQAQRRYLMPHSFLSFPAARARFVVLGLAALLAPRGCTPLKGRQGYVVDPTLTEAHTPGVAHRESVEKTLGRPTFVGPFATNEYY